MDHEILFRRVNEDEEPQGNVIDPTVVTAGKHFVRKDELFASARRG